MIYYCRLLILIYFFIALSFEKASISRGAGFKNIAYSRDIVMNRTGGQGNRRYYTYKAALGIIFCFK